MMTRMLLATSTASSSSWHQPRVHHVHTTTTSILWIGVTSTVAAVVTALLLANPSWNGACHETKKDRATGAKKSRTTAAGVLEPSNLLVWGDDDCADDDDDRDCDADDLPVPALFPAPRRCGGAIQLKPEQYKRYRELHDAVWPQVLQRMSKSHIRNFVIYYHKETNVLFQHFEWVGHWARLQLKLRQQKEDNRSAGGVASTATDDGDAAATTTTTTATAAEELEWFESDMQAISNDPVTREWWRECEPCQKPFAQWGSNTDESKLLLSEGGTGQWWAPLECVAQCGHWPLAYTKELRDPDFSTMGQTK